MYEMKVKTPLSSTIAAGSMATDNLTKRRSWTGRLKDRFTKSQQIVRQSPMLEAAEIPVDDWTWATHPHLEGHHAPSVPSLQGSVFVAANFVYDYRQKYGFEPPRPIHLGSSAQHPSPSSAWLSSTVHHVSGNSRLRPPDSIPGWPEKTSPVLYGMRHRLDDEDDEDEMVNEETINRGPDRHRRQSQFQAAEVNQNIRHMREQRQRRRATSSTRQQQPQQQEYQGGEEPPKTTVAVDRPGLIVSGERICILTGDSQRDPVILSSSNNDHQQNSHEPSKVSLRVEFQRNCPLRRSLSDRAAPKMAPTVRFQDTTRLIVKARSRGSLHDLFHPPINADATDDEMESLPPPLPTTAPPLLVVPSSSIRRTISRPQEPPPPPPPSTEPHLVSTSPASTFGYPPEESPLVSTDGAPIAPPRRIYRHSKSVQADVPSNKVETPGRSISMPDEGDDRFSIAPLLSSNRDIISNVSSDTAVPSAVGHNIPPPPPNADLSAGVISWTGRPLLTGQMVSWTAWSGHSSGTATAAEPVSPYAVIAYHDQQYQTNYPSPSSKRATAAASRSNSRNSNSSYNSSASNNDHPLPILSSSTETKRQVRRPVSRLWPSFSSIGRSHQNARASSGNRHPPEEHIYEEIDDKHLHHQPEQQQETRLPLTNPPNGVTGFSRTGRGGSFAGATRQDILRYLDELRKKHPTGIVDAETIRYHNKQHSQLSSPITTPSSPQWVPGTTASSPEVAADEEEDAQMGALLLAMRHNAVTRTSNRSNQSTSTASSTESGSQESAVSSTSSSVPVTLSGGCYQTIGGGSGEVLERNDSGVGSETSGNSTALRRLRRLRRLKQHHQQTPGQDGEEEEEEDDEDEGAVGEEPADVETLITASSTAVTSAAVETGPCWCVDCDQPVVNEASPTIHEINDNHSGADVCHRCARRRCERREVLAELLETEVRYGRDLRVLQDELYKPLLVAGLVPLRQLDAVFLNVTELSGHSSRFGQRLREAVEIALEQGDEDLLTVDVARLFLDRQTEEMMDAFRRYCVRSGEASLLLSTLEKERELLRIFLKASQLENPALRRMDLHAFLMVPVQRITKYPLLLGRLLRATAQQDVEMREALREAQAKVEFYLTAINAEAKELGNCSSASRPWRRGYSVPNLNLSLNNMMNSNNNNNSGTNSSSVTGLGGHVQQQPQPSRPSAQELMTLRLRKLAMDSLGWSDMVGATTRFVFDGQVKLTQPSDLLLTGTRSRGRSLKWQNVWLVLVTLHQPLPPDQVPSLSKEVVTGPGRLNFGVTPGNDGVLKEAALVLMKDAKNPRPGPSLYREPLMLSHCTVSSEVELPNFFEIHHIITKESFVCQTTDADQAQQWLHPLRTYSLSLGQWRKRRNALANVMMIN